MYIKSAAFLIIMLLMCKSRLKCYLGSLTKCTLSYVELCIDDPQYISLCCAWYIVLTCQCLSFAAALPKFSGPACKRGEWEKKQLEKNEQRKKQNNLDKIITSMNQK